MRSHTPSHSREPHITMLAGRAQPALQQRAPARVGRTRLVARTQCTSLRRRTRTLATEQVVAEPTTAAAASSAPAAHGQQQAPPTPEAAAAASGAQPINWFRQWYPIAILKDLDGRRPTPAQLLGIPLVLWRDGGGAWRAMEDRCPHRLAPLSEGRIDADGTLMCSYHGWQFNGQGACTRIPQIGDPKAAATACSSSKSCVASFPVKEDDGLLWVWPDASPGAAAAAAAAAPARIPELQQTDDWEPRTDWFMREVPISMETVVENVSDPCHANFTHHKVQGARSNEKGTDIKPLSAPHAGGFAMSQSSGRMAATFEFQAPCFLKYTFPSFGRVMAVYVVPTSAGACRMITRFVKNRHNHPMRPGAMGLILKVMEVIEGVRVLEHALMRNKVLDGDNHILHVQERQLLAEGPAAWQQRYFMPGTFDTGVAAWRSWLAKYGRDMPLLPKGPADLPPLMSRRQSLDRFSQHTQHCPDCRAALRRIDAALPATWAAAAAALLFAAVSAACGAPLASLNVMGAAAAAAALGWAHRSLVSFRKLFIFRDYVHADVE